jgi:hypothetical protein
MLIKGSGKASCFAAGAGLNDRVNSPSPFGIFDTDNDHVGDVRILGQHRFNLCGVHIYAAGNYHVDATVGDKDIAIMVAPTEVTN